MRNWMLLALIGSLGMAGVGCEGRVGEPSGGYHKETTTIKEPDGDVKQNTTVREADGDVRSTTVTKERN